MHIRFLGLSILPIALSMDNYSYLVREEASGTAILIDPADPEPILVGLHKGEIETMAENQDFRTSWTFVHRGHSHVARP